MFKKFFTAVMSAAMVLAISSCGKNDNEQVPETSAAETTAEGKKTIKMLVMNGGEDIYISEFNRTNEEYEIVVENREFTNLENAIDTFNLEIMAGSTPDILDGFFMPLESYAEKGLLANYYDFIDNDPEMSREDFFQNIFKAYEVNGGLYQNIVRFYLNIIAGKQSIAGEMQGRTTDDFLDLAEKYPDKKFTDWQWSKHNAFGFFMGRGWESFVDKETGKCDFCNERFYRILEFSNTFPDTVDESYKLDLNWRRSEADDLRNEKTLFASYGFSITNFYTLRIEEEQTFGEPAAVIGYPYVEGNGALIQADGSYAVFEDSPVKEGAWEFLRYFYSDEYQKKIVREYSLPVKRSAIEFAAEDAKKGLYLDYAEEYTDEYGINTDEDNQRVIDLIEGAACRSGSSDNSVYNIILEEAETYFAGQKSAEEVAEIIQNRVQNYLDENR